MRNGDVISARAKGLGICSNIEAERITIKEALDFCGERRITDFLLETIFLSLKQMILQQWRIPWELV